MAVTASAGAAPTSSAATTRLDPEHRLPASSKARATTRPPRSTVAAWACLVLSEEAGRLEGLSHTAESAGWDPIPCGSVGQAVREMERWRTQLMIVDLGSMSSLQKAAYMQFASRMGSPQRLLLICDEPTDAEGELLARQAGAWLYVPSPDFGAGMTELLDAARGVAQKLNEQEPVSF